MQNKIQDRDLIEKTISRQPHYAGKVFSVETKTVELSDESYGQRDIINHVGGAAVVALDAEHNVVLVRQYRVAFDEIVTEIPAGKLDKDEDPLYCAQRELREETGISAKNWRILSSAKPSPGYLNETIHIFLATDLEFGEAIPDQGEFLIVEKRPLKEVISAIVTGEITDAKTIIGCLLTDVVVNSDE